VLYDIAGFRFTVIREVAEGLARIYWIMLLQM